MVRDETGETLAEAAARHGRAYNTLRNQWARHPHWPAPIGKRGRHNIYDPYEIDDWVREHLVRGTADITPSHLYTARELEDAGIGITAATIRADLHRGRWPEPDRTGGGTNRWFGTTVLEVLAKRRGYRRH